MNGGPAALMNYLRSIDLTGFNIRRAPDTEGLRDQKLANLIGVDAWWRDTLFRAELPVTSNDDLSEESWDSSTQFVLTQALLDDCANWMRRQRYGSNAPGPEQFAKHFRKICPGATRDRLTSGKRPWGYRIPPRAVCVADFERRFGVSLSMEEDGLE